MGKLHDYINKYNKELAGSIIKLSDSPYDGIERASTGSFSCDISVGGGLPCSSIIELFGEESTGKSLLCLKTIASVQQKTGKDCVYIDLEGALTKEWAAKVGVNPEKLYIVRPKTAEKALDTLVDLVSSNEVGVIVVDSVAALCPIIETEESLEKNQMGVAARLMSKALRILASALQPESLTDKEKYNPCIVIFINQTREKIGILYGCVHGETLVYTDNGGIPIADIVNNKLKLKVLSYNINTHEYEFKAIKNYYNNCNILNNKDFIHIQTESIDGMGRFGFTVTPTHKVLTKNGWKEAHNIILNDYIQSTYKNIINETLADFLYGTLMGDSKISVRTRNTACITIRDNRNKEYEAWKINKLKKYFNFKKRAKNPSSGFASNYIYEFAKIKKEIGNRNPCIFLDNHFSKLGLALWIMDDGHFDNQGGHCRYSISVKRFKGNKEILDNISNSFNKRGYKNKYNIKDGNIVFNKEVSLKIAQDICKYIPLCMQYKLPNAFKNNYKDFELTNNCYIKEDFVKVLEKRYASKRQMRLKCKYDIEVEGNHNYVVGGKHNGVVIHNSPLTTPGGKALKFYSNVRIHLKKGDTLRNEAKSVIGQNIKFTVVKNKTYKPFQVGEFSFYYNGHIDNEESIINYAIAFELIKQKGAWIYLDDKKFQGKEAVIEYLKKDSKAILKLKKEVIDIAMRD